jgi:hypothetical protein
VWYFNELSRNFVEDLYTWQIVHLSVLREEVMSITTPMRTVIASFGFPKLIQGFLARGLVWAVWLGHPES